METALPLYSLHAVARALGTDINVGGFILTPASVALGRFQCHGGGGTCGVVSNERALSLPARVNKKENGGGQED